MRLGGSHRLHMCLFNKTVSCYDYTALVIGEWVWGISGITVTGNTEVYWQKPDPVPLGSPQIPHGIAWHWTQASAVRPVTPLQWDQWLTAWATTQAPPICSWTYWQRENSTLLTEIKPWFSSHAKWSLMTALTELPSLKEESTGTK